MPIPRCWRAGRSAPPCPREGFAVEGALPVFGRFIVSGFEHIIPKGLDHILFVLGLFFFSLRFGPLLWQVTAFTLAHTVTLALASLQIVSIPASIVEPLIAASIVYVAVENIFGGKVGPGANRGGLRLRPAARAGLRLGPERRGPARRPLCRSA